MSTGDPVTDGGVHLSCWSVALISLTFSLFSSSLTPTAPIVSESHLLVREASWVVLHLYESQMQIHVSLLAFLFFPSNTAGQMNWNDPRYQSKASSCEYVFVFGVHVTVATTAAQPRTAHVNRHQCYWNHSLLVPQWIWNKRHDNVKLRLFEL